MFIVKNDRQQEELKQQISKFKDFVRPTPFALVDTLYVIVGVIALSEFYILWHLYSTLSILYIIAGVLYLMYSLYVLYKFRPTLIEQHWRNKVIQRQFMRHALPSLVFGGIVVACGTYQGWELLRYLLING